MGSLEIVDNLLQRGLLARSQPERQNAARGFADPVVNGDPYRLSLGRGRAAARENTNPKEKRLFENQPLLRPCREPIQDIDRGACRRKMRREERLLTRRQLQA